ncbi:hypothetical protein E2C01_064617 [Portunus trituberculatus]|uniref:Uncharacterized protein n=1 Tax=Portunus trituberculatus TaxID=210409 RepID=A0A5B7HCB1_PORTR|nr:hypothetical protein [Portunus trituberculatus]
MDAVVMVVVEVLVIVALNGYWRCYRGHGFNNGNKNKAKTGPVRTARRRKIKHGKSSRVAVVMVKPCRSWSLQECELFAQCGAVMVIWEHRI